jgi:hypothetical protein
MEIEHMIFIPATLVGCVKFGWPDMTMDDDDLDAEGHPRHDSYCKRWYSHTCDPKRVWHLLADTFLFDFLLFYICGILVVGTLYNDETAREMLADQAQRRSFVFRLAGITFSLGSICFIFLRELSIAAIVSLVASTAVSNFTSKEALLQIVFAGGIPMAVIALICLIACFVGMTQIVRRINRIMEPILVGLTLSHCLFVFIDTWPFYLLRSDNNVRIFWLPLMVGGIFMLLAWGYRRCAKPAALWLKEHRMRKYAHVHGDEGDSELSRMKPRRKEESDSE